MTITAYEPSTKFEGSHCQCDKVKNFTELLIITLKPNFTDL